MSFELFSQIINIRNVDDIMGGYKLFSIFARYATNNTIIRMGTEIILPLNWILNWYDIHKLDQVIPGTQFVTKYKEPHYKLDSTLFNTTIK